MVTQLQALLAAADAQAVQVWDDNAVWLRQALPEHFRQIEQAIGQFEFDQALTLMTAALVPAVAQSL